MTTTNYLEVIMIFSYSSPVSSDASLDELLDSLLIKLDGVEIKFRQLDKDYQNYIINAISDGRLLDAICLITDIINNDLQLKQERNLKDG
jgi:hypothetical protein